MKTITTALIIILVNSIAWCQFPIETRITLAPPYPSNIDAYLDFLDLGIVEVINSTDQNIEVYFEVKLEESSGKIRINTNGILGESLDVAPGITLLSPDDIRTLFSDLTDSDFSTVGLSQAERDAIMISRQMPEGTYSLCIKGFDEIGNPLTDPSLDGCFTFDVIFVERPIILYPADDVQFPIIADEFIVPLWAHDLNDAEASLRTEYILKLIDITEQEITDPIRAMLDPGVSPEFEENVGNQYSYTLMDDIELPLIEGHQYAMRVTAFDPDELIGFQFGGHSEVVVFQYGEDSGEDEDISDANTDEAGGCVGECTIPAPTDLSSKSFKKGDSVFIGRFKMSIDEITGDENAGYNGEGIIQIGFLNNIKVKVTFESLKANKDKKVFAGQAFAKTDVPTSNIGVDVVEHLGSHIPAIGQEGAAELKDAYTNVNKLVSALSGEPTTLPLGWNRQIEGQEMIVGLSEMIFLPTKAELQAIFQIDNPEWGEYLPSFAADQIVFSPDGFDHGVKLFLTKDYGIQYGENSFYFKSIQSDGTVIDTGSYIIIDCHGFHSGRISAEMVFSRDIIIPDSEQGAPGDGQVVARLRGDMKKGNHFILSAEIDAFQIPGMEGFSLEIEGAYFDYSDLENPIMHFPDQYEVLDQINTWNGFYMNQITFRTPQDWVGDGTRKSISFNNVIIDKMGLSTSFQATEIINIDDGNLDGWSFSVDTFQLTIVQNEFINGSLGGRLGIPIMDDGGTLKYTGLIDQSNKDTLSFNLNVRPQDEFVVPMMVAKMELYNTSYVEMKINGSKKSAEASFTGKVGINQSFLPDRLEALITKLDIDLPGVGFQNLYFNSNKEFSRPTFSLASPKKKLGGFSINIDPSEGGIVLESNEDNVTLKITPEISLVGAKHGITASATVDFVSTITGRYLSLEEVGLSRIEVKDATVGAFKFDGFIEFFNNELEGKGAAGGLNVTLPGDIEGGFNVKFGTYRSNPNDTSLVYDSEDYYNYWYVDGIVKFGRFGVPICGTPLKLYGFGGGAYYHMSRMTNDSKLPNPDDLYAEEDQTYNANPPESGIQYNNDYSTLFGLKATAVIGASNPNSFVSDITLEASFTDNGGVTLGLDANGYIMSDPITKDPSITIKGSIKASNLTGSWVVSGSGENGKVLQVFVDALDGKIIGCKNQGGSLMIDADLLASQDEWYIYLGTPSDRGCLEIMEYLKITGYFMAGHGLDSHVPELPEFISTILNKSKTESDGGSIEGDFFSSNKMERSDNNEGGSPEDAMGFAFGANLRFEDRLNLAILYGELEVEAGFDVNMTFAEGRFCANNQSSDLGINGWYATGQIYAGFRGELGLHIDIAIWEGDLVLIEAAAAMMLKGGGPNPLWMKGRVAVEFEVLGGMFSGSANFDVEYGEECIAYDPNPFDKFKFIDEIKPNNATRDFPVYGAINASFANQIKQYILPRGEGSYLYVTPTIDYFSVETMSGVKVSAMPFELKDNNLIAQLSLSNWLAPFTKYKAKIKLVAYENGIRVKTRTGDLWEEIKEVTFTTGAMPEEIDRSMLDYTVPFDDQLYVLQNNLPVIAGLDQFGRATGKVGFIKFTSRPPNEFLDQVKYNYTLDIDPGHSIWLNQNSYSIIDDQNRIRFRMPNLNNQTLYKISLFRQDKMREKSEAERIDSQVSVTETQSTNDGSTASLKRFNINLNESYGLVNKKEIYSWYFATSKFNSFEEKMSHASNNKLSESTNNSIYVDLSEAERFEKYDVTGYRNPANMRKTPPLTVLNYSADESTGYFYQLANSYYYRILADIGWHEILLKWTGEVASIFKNAYTPIIVDKLNSMAAANNPLNKNASTYRFSTSYHFEMNTMNIWNYDDQLSSSEKYLPGRQISRSYAFDRYSEDIQSKSKVNAKSAYGWAQTIAILYNSCFDFGMPVQSYPWIKDRVRALSSSSSNLNINDSQKNTDYKLNFTYGYPGFPRAQKTVTAKF